METSNAASRFQDTPGLWEQHRNLIRQLYQGQDGHKQTLGNVRNILIERYNFPLSPLSIYEARFREIGLRKKMKKEDWLPIWLHCRKLKEDGKVPEVVLCGSRIPWVKAWKEIRRVKAHLAACDLPLPTLPQGVVVRTKDTTVPHSLSPPMIQTRTYTSTLVVTPLRAMKEPTPRAFGSSLITILSPSEMRRTQTPQCTVPMKNLAMAGVWKTRKTTALSNLPYLQFLRSVKYTSCRGPGVGETTMSADGLDLSLSRLSIYSNPGNYDRYPSKLFRSHDEGLQSKQALTLEIDPFHLLFKAVLRLSNNLVAHSIRLGPGDEIMIRLLFTRVPESVLSLLARSKLPSLRSALKALINICAQHDDGIFSKMLDIVPKEDMKLMKILFDGLFYEMSPRKLEDVIRKLPSHFGGRDGVRTVLEGAIRRRSWLCASILINWMGRACREEQDTQITWSRIEDALVDLSHIEHVYLCMKTYQFSDDLVVDSFRNFTERAREAAPKPSEIRILLSDLGQETLRAIAIYRETDWSCCCGSKSPNPRRQASRFACRILQDKHANLVRFKSMIQSFEQECTDAITLIGVYIALIRVDWSLHSGLASYPAYQTLDQRVMNKAVERLCQYGPTTDVVEMLSVLLEHEVAIGSKHLAIVAEWGFHEQKDRVIALRTLESLGASIGALGGHALVEAAKRHDLFLVQWLLGAGVDMNGSHPFWKERGAELTVMGIAIEVGSRGELPLLAHFLMECGAILRLRPTDDGPIPWLARLIDESKVPEPLSELFPFLENVCLAGSEAVILVTKSVREAHWELLELLLGKGAPCTPDCLGDIVSRGGPAHLIQKLIQDMVDIRTSGSPALMAACRSCDLVLCKQLLTLGVDIGLTDPDGCTALHHACDATLLTESEAESQVLVVQSLLEAGADVNKSGCWGQTPLVFAAYQGNLELAVLLLNKGADCNAAHNIWEDKGYFGIPGRCKIGTSLDFAASEGRLDMVKLLLNAGAESAQRRLTPYDGAILEACRSKNWEILLIILQHTGLSKETLRDIILESQDLPVLRRALNSAPKTAEFGFGELDYGLDENVEDIEDIELI